MTSELIVRELAGAALDDLAMTKKQHTETMKVAVATATALADAVKRNIELEAEVARLKVDNASLAAWQCIHTDGKTGLVNTEHGHQICAKDATITTLTAENERLSARVAGLEKDNENMRKAALCIRPYIKGQLNSGNLVDHSSLPSAFAAFNEAFSMPFPVARRELEEGGANEPIAGEHQEILDAIEACNTGEDE